MFINGLPVVDATGPLEIEITATDVAKGNSKDPAACAAAQACMRMGFTEARVHLSRTYVRKGKVWIRHKTDPNIRTELVAFDRGAMFAPGHYVLTPPAPSDVGRKFKPINQEKRDRKNPNPKKMKSKPHRVYGVRQRGANV